MSDTPISPEGEEFCRRLRAGTLGKPKDSANELAALDDALGIPPIGQPLPPPVARPVHPEPQQPDLFSPDIYKPAEPSIATHPLTMHDIRARIHEKLQAARQLPLEIPKHEAASEPQPERKGWRALFGAKVKSSPAR